MKVSTKRIMLALATAVTLFVTACTEGEKPTVEPDSSFDKTAMLTNYADNLIIPAYTGMQQQLQLLEPAINTFLANPTAANQQTLKLTFKEAYLQFERISVYQFGPAETVLLNNFLNMFPANKSTIESNISSGSYDLNGNLSIDQQGFPALDYLLFSSDAVQKFNDPSSANRKKYVHDLITRMNALTSTVLTEWNGTYRSKFITNTKADAGSPIGFMINQFALESDQLKGPRIGYPYGKQSGGTLFVDKCEAYYSGFSAELAVENLTSLKKAYTGGEGKGMDDYLIALKKDQLNTDVLNQFDLTLSKLKAIPDPLATSFTDHKDLVDAAYREIQSLLTLLKTDVASATGVRITYQDSDGD